ncbi:MAG: hypothetical protein KatS3mg076_2878 [Candidatus Binatia bacterium]|nr:MAG: hypothetical protein KatS3mg076_2878 [Candidatus Binatia bacterium]
MDVLREIHLVWWGVVAALVVVCVVGFYLLRDRPEKS